MQSLDQAYEALSQYLILDEPAITEVIESFGVLQEKVNSLEKRLIDFLNPENTRNLTLLEIIKHEERDYEAFVSSSDLREVNFPYDEEIESVEFSPNREPLLRELTLLFLTIDDLISNTLRPRLRDMFHDLHALIDKEVIYKALLVLTELLPLNDEDVITYNPIHYTDREVDIEGHQYNRPTLVEHLNLNERDWINPFTNQPFCLEDQERLRIRLLQHGCRLSKEFRGHRLKKIGLNLIDLAMTLMVLCLIGVGFTMILMILAELFIAISSIIIGFNAVHAFTVFYAIIESITDILITIPTQVSTGVALLGITCIILSKIAECIGNLFEHCHKKAPPEKKKAKIYSFHFFKPSENVDAHEIVDTIQKGPELCVV